MVTLSRNEIKRKKKKRKGELSILICQILSKHDLNDRVNRERTSIEFQILEYSKYSNSIEPKAIPWHDTIKSWLVMFLSGVQLYKRETLGPDISIEQVSACTLK